MKIRYKKSEQGSTLITVLIMLILLTIAGTWAIRGSITSLNVSTNAQAQSLLMQSSDSVFVTMENRTNDDLKFAQMRVGDGALAFALRPENKRELEKDLKNVVTQAISRAQAYAAEKMKAIAGDLNIPGL